MGDVTSIHSYRHPTPRNAHRGSFEACPACGESFVVEETVCTHCRGTKFVSGTSSGHMVSCCANCSCPGYTKVNPFEKKRVNTSPGAYCGPGQRIVVGRRGWWIFGADVPCDEPGAHLHQHCRTCGWRGIVLPETEDA